MGLDFFQMSSHTKKFDKKSYQIKQPKWKQWKQKERTKNELKFLYNENDIYYKIRANYVHAKLQMRKK